MGLSIRDTVEADLPGILAIHNEAVMTGTALWTTTPSDLDGRRAVLAERRGKGHAFLTADVDGAVAGYGSFGDFRPHDGYSRTVEHSIYVDTAYRRRGIATLLLTRLIEEARRAGKHVMIGGIAADNAASIALHERHAFVETGRLPEVGHKFGRYLDLVFLQLTLS